VANSGSTVFRAFVDSRFFSSHLFLMNEPTRSDDALAVGPPVPVAPVSVDHKDSVPGRDQPPSPGAASPAAAEAALSAEEQMERFAQDLKENDWGHQPC